MQKTHAAAPGPKWSTVMNTLRPGTPRLATLALVAALLAPAAARADEPRAHDPELGRAIAEQGNRALLAILEETRRNVRVRHLTPPALPAYAAQPAAPVKLAQNR